MKCISGKRIVELSENPYACHYSSSPDWIRGYLRPAPKLPPITDNTPITVKETEQAVADYREYIASLILKVQPRIIEATVYVEKESNRFVKGDTVLKVYNLATRLFELGGTLDRQSIGYNSCADEYKKNFRAALEDKR